MESNDRWQVILIGGDDGYGIAVRRVKVLEMFCRGMSGDKAEELCALLNQKDRATKSRS